MFIGASVTFNAILETADSFLDVLTPNLRWRMFVTAVTGVTTVVVAHMAGRTLGRVIAVKHEEFVVVESRRFPFLLAVALRAVAAKLLMQRIGWRFVACLALRARCRVQQGMVKMSLWPEALHAGVIAVAGHAILVNELLVKRRCRKRLGDRQTRRRQAADVFRFVAGDATSRLRASEWCMTGKAVGI